MERDRRTAMQTIAGMAGVALLPASREVSAMSAPNLAEQAYTRLDAAEKPVRGGTFRLAVSQYVGSMNPNRWPVNDWISLSYFHEKLVVNDGAYRPTVPYVAESVVREGPTAVLVTLRAGIQFHDGSPLTAEALKYQFDWIRKPENGAWNVGNVAGLESTEVVGPLKLRFNLKHPWASFEGMLSTSAGYVLSANALQQDAKKFESSAPKGLGPYMVEEASPDNFLKLKRNPNWWLAKALGRPDAPYFDGMLISVIPDPAVRLANFRAGKIDLLMLDKPQYAALYEDKNVSVQIEPANHVAAYRFNNAKGPCTDIRVRKAISHAIDRKALIQGTQFGLARPANGLYPSDHWAHNAAIKPVDHNPVLAKELLAQAGFDKGLTVRGFVFNTPEAIQVAEATKNMLLQVGINWQFDALAPVAAAARRTAGDFDLAAGGWTFILDPDLAMTNLYHPNGNFSQGRSVSPELLKDIDAARNEMAIDRRQAMYQALGRRVAEDHLDVWLWWPLYAIAFQKWVRGYSNEGNLKYKESWWFTHPLWFADGKPGTPT